MARFWNYRRIMIKMLLSSASTSRNSQQIKQEACRLDAKYSFNQIE